jgi:NAD+ diphosphatase
VLLSQVPVLSRTGHDRAAVHRDSPSWLADAWERGRALVITPEHSAPVADGPVLDLRPTTGLTGERYFLGLADDVPVFAVRAPRDLVADRWADLREVGADLGDRDAGLLTTAVALSHWHDRHSHCALCGARTEVERGGWVRRCPVDSSEHFPRTDPAVIMLVHDGGDRCVLGRQAAWPPGRFSILAGFVEPGESSEAAVEREVDEEVGLAVTAVTYAGSQPWPFPSSLMLGFEARADGGEPAVKDDELEDVRWFSLDEVRAAAAETGLLRLPPPISIARFLIDRWMAARAV